jgi:hypothetical protein
MQTVVRPSSQERSRSRLSTAPRKPALDAPEGTCNPLGRVSQGPAQSGASRRRRSGRRPTRSRPGRGATSARQPECWSRLQVARRQFRGPAVILPRTRPGRGWLASAERCWGATGLGRRGTGALGRRASAFLAIIQGTIAAGRYWEWARPSVALRGKEAGAVHLCLSA